MEKLLNDIRNCLNRVPSNLSYAATTVTNALAAGFVIICLVCVMPLLLLYAWLFITLANGWSFWITTPILGALLFVLAVFVVWCFTTNTRHEQVHLRGMRRISEEEAQRYAQGLLSPGDPGIQFGSILLPWASRLTHFVFAAATRAGKSVLISLLLQSVLPRFRPGGDNRALILDYKRNVISQLAGMKLKVRVGILNPLDKRSVRWDIAADCGQYASFAIALQIAAVLFPLNEKSTGEPFWDRAAQLILASVISSFQMNSPFVWTLRDVVITLLSREWLSYILARNPETFFCYRDFFQGEPIATNIMVTLETKIFPYLPVAFLWHHAKSKVSLNDWVTGDSILVLGQSEKLREAIDPINRVIVQRIVELIADEDDSTTRETFVVLDECREMGKLPSGVLRKLMNIGGGKGCSVILGFTDHDGMDALYGDHEARELIGQAANIVLGRVQNPNTAEMFSKTIGEEEVQRPNFSETDGPNGKSTGVNWSNDTPRVVMPSEFQTIPQTSVANGLTAFFKSAFIPHAIWKGHIPGDKLFKQGMLWPKSTRVVDFDPRPVEEQRYIPWDASDRKRLNLPDDPEEALKQLLGKEPADPPENGEELRGISRTTI